MSTETAPPPVDPALGVDPVAAAAVDKPARQKRANRRRNRRPVKRATVVTHRWLSLILGTALLVITTSGAAVVFSPEWKRWSNSDVYEIHNSAQPISMTQAMATVEKAHPSFKASTVNVYVGLYEVSASNTDKFPGFYGVDPGTGRITGYANPNSGVMAFMVQVHECLFTCEDHPGYLSWMTDPVPTLGMHWLKDVTWSGLILGIGGLLLLFLALSGIWLWWPGVKRMSHGFRVRTKKGRFARDYDLHQVVGMAAIPFLLMWGLTGANFEFHWVSTAFYAATGGEEQPEKTFASKAVEPKTTPDIGLDAAVTASRPEARPDARLVYASLPAAGDATAYYDLWYSEAWDQYSHGGSPGQLEVQVDRHNAARVQVNDYGTAPTVSNKILDNFGGATLHYGQSFNGWWRMLWFVFGLIPLLLAATGISTWLAKRAVRKRRKRAQAQRAATASLAPVGATSGAAPAANVAPPDGPRGVTPETAETADSADAPEPGTSR